MPIDRKTILYAPNIHTGGGLILFNELISSWNHKKKLYIITDNRLPIKTTSSIKKNIEILYTVKPSLISRAISELRLLLETIRYDVTLICFHNIPPIFARPKFLIIYLQNRILIDDKYRPSNHISSIIVYIQRVIIKYFSTKGTLFIVQSPAMRLALEKFFSSNKKSVDCKVLPFLNSKLCQNSPFEVENSSNDKFIYPAAGDEHKNHTALLNAWILLGKDNIYPKLYLTVHPKYKDLNYHIKRCVNEFNLNIENFGELEYTEILSQYNRMSALIYPSKIESFGLPLIEANAMSLPIIAAELDYVRDVCSPSETFDPNSSISIARAVMRFLKIKNDPIKILNGHDFWDELLINNINKEANVQK